MEKVYIKRTQNLIHRSPFWLFERLPSHLKLYERLKRLNNKYQTMAFLYLEEGEG